MYLKAESVFSRRLLTFLNFSTLTSLNQPKLTKPK